VDYSAIIAFLIKKGMTHHHHGGKAQACLEPEKRWKIVLMRLAENDEVKFCPRHLKVVENSL